MKIFINAGHGGVDPGACSKQGIKESDVAASIALAVVNRLKLNGYPVEYFQQKESHFEIAPVENKSGATCFISIHCNSFSNETANGIEVLYCKGSKKGERLAQIMKEELIYSTRLANRGIKAREDLTVLNRTKAPAILIELGFISNPNDLRAIVETPEKFVNGIWEAIKTYNEAKLI